MDKELKKIVILGIDPGTTIGLAVIDIDGVIKHIDSFKDKGIKEILNYIIEKELEPFIISTDKKEIPLGIKSIASKIDAIVYSPKKDLSKKEKANIVKQLMNGDANKSIKESLNDHEKDALAAALNAYEYYKEKIKRYKKIAKELGIKNKKYLKFFLEGNSKGALIDLLNKDSKATLSSHFNKKTKNKERKVSLIGLNKKLFNELISKEEKIEELKKEIKELEEKISIYKKRLYVVNAQKIINKQKNTIRELRKEIDEYEKEYKEIRYIIKRFIDDIYNSFPPVKINNENSKNENRKNVDLEKQLEDLKKEIYKKVVKIIEMVENREIEIIKILNEKKYSKSKKDDTNRGRVFDPKISWKELTGKNYSQLQYFKENKNKNYWNVYFLDEKERSIVINQIVFTGINKKRIIMKTPEYVLIKKPSNDVFEIFEEYKRKRIMKYNN